MGEKPAKKVKLRTLDKSRPYAELFGIIGASFEQDGVMFTSAGIETNDAHEMVAEEEPDNDVDDAEIKPATVISGPEIQAAPADSFETMHERHLKALVEGYGGSFFDRDSAVQFLRQRPIAA